MKNNSLTLLFGSLAAVSATAISFSGSAEAVSFQGLGDLPRGKYFSEANGVERLLSGSDETGHNR